jgi:sugar (pentulose or hexulose) kinase
MVASGISVGTHVVDGQQALLTGFAEGFSLQRFLRFLGVDEADRALLDEAAAVVESGDLRVIGIDEPSASLVGITADVTPARVWRAALDAVERRVADLLTIMAREVGPHQRVIVVGGWARNPGTRAAKRMFLGECAYPDIDEAGVRGAALLAARAAGLVPGLDAWSMRAVNPPPE